MTNGAGEESQGPSLLPAAANADAIHQIAQFAARLGINLTGFGPDLSRLAPSVDLAQPIRALAHDLAMLLKKEDLFLSGVDVVTVNPNSGEIERMTSKRFPGWVEAFTAFRTSGQRRRASITPDEAGQILQTDIFRRSLKPLDCVHTLRLPVFRKSGAIEFLAEGYDLETRSFTVNLLRYDMSLGLTAATDFLDTHGEEYCFTWPEKRDQVRPAVAQNRSWAVQIAAMLSSYCSAMFQPGTPRPMFIYLSNKPGTGKSTLAAMALMPVYGKASGTSLPKDHDRLIAALETAARRKKPYLLFDDVNGGIFGAPLYQFLTSRSHTGRVMGGNGEMFEELNRTQVLTTGSGIKFDSNLSRRSLAVDMFLETAVEGRTFRKTITPTYLAREDVRAKFLAALCAIVRNYAEVWPTLSDDRKALIRPLASFEEWSGPISAMVQLAGYSDPLARAPFVGGGTEDEDEMRELLERVAGELEGGHTFSRSELTTKARDWNLLEGLVGIVGDPDLRSEESKRWGRRLEKFRAQILTDARGRRFRVGSQHKKNGAHYPFSFVESEAAQNCW